MTNHDHRWRKAWQQVAKNVWERVEEHGTYRAVRSHVPNVAFYQDLYEQTPERGLGFEVSFKAPKRDRRSLSGGPFPMLEYAHQRADQHMNHCLERKKNGCKTEKFLLAAQEQYPDGISFMQALRLFHGIPMDKPLPSWEQPDHMQINKILDCNACPTVYPGAPGNRWVILNTKPPYVGSVERLEEFNKLKKQGRLRLLEREVAAITDDLEPQVEEWLRENLKWLKEDLAAGRHEQARVQARILMLGVPTAVCGRTHDDPVWGHFECGNALGYLEGGRLVVDEQKYKTKAWPCTRCMTLNKLP